MKLKFLHRLLLAAALLASSLSAAETQSAAPEPAREMKTAGPNRGRVIEGIEPSAEFFVTPERKVQITFLAKDNTPVAPAAQRVVVTCGDRTAPTRLTFAKTGNVLLSNTVLPAGNDFPVVVEITPAPGARKVVEKFHLDSTPCGDCQNPEYACICAH